MKSPDEEVAQRIIEQFRKKKLLSETALEKLESQLASGKLTAEDWRLNFETDRPGKEATADED